MTNKEPSDRQGTFQGRYYKSKKLWEKKTKLLRKACPEKEKEKENILYLITPKKKSDLVPYKHGVNSRIRAGGFGEGEVQHLIRGLFIPPITVVYLKLSPVT